MEPPQLRPGRVAAPADEAPTRLVARFRNSAEGNAVIQLLQALGVPGDGLGVIPPEQLPRGQGMILTIACPDEALVPRVEAICRSQGAEVHRQRR